jgi:hypothetical protein
MLILVTVVVLVVMIMMMTITIMNMVVVVRRETRLLIPSSKISTLPTMTPVR